MKYKIEIIDQVIKKCYTFDITLEHTEKRAFFVSTIKIRKHNMQGEEKVTTVSALKDPCRSRLTKPPVPGRPRRTHQVMPW